jgi:hypothetical protein
MQMPCGVRVRGRAHFSWAGQEDLSGVLKGQLEGVSEDSGRHDRIKSSVCIGKCGALQH